VSSGDISAATRALGAFGAVTSWRDCSLCPATVCVALGRQPCGAQDNTCGPCLANYVGEPGPGDLSCVSPSAVSALLSRRRLDSGLLGEGEALGAGKASGDGRNRSSDDQISRQNRRRLVGIGASCGQNADCDGWLLCSTQATPRACYRPAKTCPMNCSAPAGGRYFASFIDPHSFLSLFLSFHIKGTSV
jgi:hypothetical protein